MKNKGESFSEFVENTKDDGVPVWDLTDSLGIVTPEDFENVFDKKTIEKNYDELTHLWFKGLNYMVDFGMLLDCVKEEFGGK